MTRYAIILCALIVLPIALAPGIAQTPPRSDDMELPKPPDVSKRKGFAIRITTPESNDFRFGRSESEADVTAADPELIEQVEFFVADQLVFIDTERPYRCVFDFGTEPRSWVIRSIAYHREGVTVSDTVILKRVILNYAVSVNRVILYATARSKGGDGPRFSTDLQAEDLVLQVFDCDRVNSAKRLIQQNQ